MAEDIEYSIIKSPIQRFLDATDELERHVWGFKFMRREAVGTASDVIGVYIEELEDMATQYRTLLKEVTDLSKGKCSEKACRCLSFKLADFPEFRPETFYESSDSSFKQIFSFYFRFRKTTEFHSLLRNIQSLFMQITDCLEFVYTGKCHFLPQEYYDNYLFKE